MVGNSRPEPYNGAMEPTTQQEEPMTVTLAPERARFVRQKVREGEFRNADDAVDRAIERLQEDEEQDIARSARILEERLGDPQSGIPLDEVFGSIAARHGIQMPGMADER